MGDIFVFREKLINLYIKRGEILLVVLKFLIGFFIFRTMGYISFGALGTGHILAISLFFGLLCTVISPFGFYLLTVAASAIYLYSVSVELCMIVVLVMFIIGVFYIRLFPKEALFIPALMICFHFNIPYVVILFAGIYAGLSGIVPVMLGTIIWGVFVPCLKPMSEVAPKASFELLSAPEKFTDMFAVLTERGFLTSGYFRLAIFYGILIAIFVILNKLVIINYIKEMSIIGMGIILIAGTLVINGTTGLGMNPALIIGCGIASIIIMLVIRFFDNVLDYKRAQRVQFEDDEYYYYVKAVPKIKNKRKKRDW